jgi:predicted ArsR family transcriptional regulator
LSIPPSSTVKPDQEIGSLSVDFHHRTLVDSLLVGLVKLLEDVAGIEDASTFIGSVAGHLGSELEKKYSAALGIKHFKREQLSAVLVDLQNRAGGKFFVIEDGADRIVLGNSKCPLGKAIRGHPSLCMMTSNVLGRLTANAVGYAAVDLEKAIARGDRGCLVVIDLVPTELRLDAREYFRDDAFPL